MKTTLVLIPDTPAVVNRKAYITDCIKETIALGCLPLMYEFYKEVLFFTDFLKTSLEQTDKVIIYQDFEQGEALRSVVEAQDFKGEIIMANLQNHQKHAMSLEDILREVALKTETQVQQLKDRSRERNVVDARFLFFKRAWVLTGFTLARIGEVVNRDHATVLHGIREIDSVRELQTLYHQHYGDS